MGLLVLLLISQCNAPNSTTPEMGSMEELAVVENYQVPVFSNNDRVEKIRGAADEFEKIFTENASSRNIPGIAYGVVVDGDLVVSGASGVLDLENKTPSSVNSAFRIASMTKSFTAMAILKLRDEGKLSLEDPVRKYIPEMDHVKMLTDDSPPIDIENLLTMTPGFPEDNPWGDRQLEVPNEALIELIQDGLSFSSVPGLYYEYSNLGYAILGNIVSKVSGTSYQEYIQQNILIPLGMTHTYWEFEEIPKDQFAIGYRWEDEEWKTEPILHDGAFGAMGGLITTIEDFSKYVNFHLSAWPPRNGDDTGPVRRSTLREMHTPNYPYLRAGGTDYKGDPCPNLRGYGYGLSIVRDCNGIKAVSHGGALPGYGSNYVFFPDYGVGVMAFGNLTYTGPLPRAAIEALLFETLELDPRELPVSDILEKRQKQVVDLIQNWDPDLEAAILADNFYLDRSRNHRMTQIKEQLNKAGAFIDVGSMDPYNQLRGSFNIKTENGRIRVFFSMSPENDPKIQRLVVSFRAEEG